jgi:CHAT domain-containing protein/tetratricopeptide (TPR) repeat protein
MLEFLPLTCCLLLAGPDTLEAPVAQVAAAVRAVEADSAETLASRWKARLSRDSTDRSALFGLATLDRLRYAYPAAEQLYRRVLGRDSAGYDALAAYAWLGLAQGFDAQGLNAPATAALEKARAAARRVHDPAVEGEALLILSLQRAFGQGVEEGLATLDTVERLVPPTRYDVHAERLRQRAALRAMVGRPEGRADARAALDAARKSGYQRAIAQALRSQAQLLQFEGKRDSSIQVLKQAEELYRRAHDRAQLATALLWHVNALLNQGDLGPADQLVRQAMVEGRAAGNQFSVAAAYTAAGAISISLGDYSAASEALDHSISLFHQLQDLGGEMKARDYLAVTALAAGDIAGARQQTLQVLKWNQQIGDPLIQFSAHRNLAIIAMHERNWTAAQKALDDAHALAGKLNRPLWTGELSYDDGRLALLQGNLDAAERALFSYLTTLDSSQHVFRHDARVKLAEIHARRGQLDRAVGEATDAWDELDRWRATLSNQELRLLAFQASPTEMSDRDAGVVTLVNQIASGGQVADAFALAERRRARELADRLAQARPVGFRVSAADIIARIPDSTAVLEYVTGSFGAPTTLFLLTRAEGSGSIRALTLTPIDSLEQQIVRFESLIRSGMDFTREGSNLASALLLPALARLGPGIDRLIVIPDGPLHRLPFDALQLQNRRFVSERFTISSAPSAAVLTALWRRNERPDRPMQLLAFGDPSSPADADSLPRLRRSAEEARLVARYSPRSVVRLRDEASAAYLKRADLTPFRVVHFATHTVVDEHASARTALLLAPGEGESGRVSANDLARLRLNADLVVLSSCRSAGGVVVAGEGVQGFIAPLLQAGTQSVVATQWEIGDRNALKFVKFLYGHLAAGQPVATALRLAKLDAIRDKMPARDWAAFTTVGNPLTRVPLRAPPWWRNPWRIVALLLVPLAGLLIYLFKIRSGRRPEDSWAPGVASRTHQR